MAITVPATLMATPLSFVAKTVLCGIRGLLVAQKRYYLFFVNSCKLDDSDFEPKGPYLPFQNGVARKGAISNTPFAIS